jgi:hypothetical protein
MHTTDTLLKLLDATQVYFQGEKIEALVFILPLGLLSLVFGGWLVTDGGSGFARGVAIPFLLMGLVMSTVGATVGFRTPAQVAAVESALHSDPPSARAAETARMAKVNGAWKIYLVMWAGFGVTGLVLRFASRNDFLQGLGIALVFFAGVGLLVDGFAERRTHPYTDALSAPGADQR